MEKKISFYLFNNIKTQIANIFSANEIRSSMNAYGENLCKKIPNTEGKRYSKEKIFEKSLSVFNEDEKIEYFRQIKENKKVRNNVELFRQINMLISFYDDTDNSLKYATFNSLKKYPKNIKECCQSAYDSYDEGENREALDKIRVTIEILVKYITGSEASLENQKNKLGKLLENKGVDKKIRNILFNILKSYEIVQNDYVKHNYIKILGKNEVSLLMNLSSVIIKFLVECDKIKDKNI